MQNTAHKLTISAYVSPVKLSNHNLNFFFACHSEIFIVEMMKMVLVGLRWTTSMVVFNENVKVIPISFFFQELSIWAVQFLMIFPFEVDWTFLILDLQSPSPTYLVHIERPEVFLSKSDCSQTPRFFWEIHPRPRPNFFRGGVRKFSMKVADLETPPDPPPPLKQLILSLNWWIFRKSPVG